MMNKISVPQRGKGPASLRPSASSRFLLAALLALLVLGACTNIEQATRVEPQEPAAQQQSQTPTQAEPTELEPVDAPAVQAEKTFDPLTAPLDAEIPIAPEVRTGVLDNGLEYYIRTNKKPENRAELRLAIDAGSILEEDDQRGLAHFLEHMAFNGTENFEKHEMIDYLQSIGMRFGADINAYTSFDETVYFLTLPTDDDAIVEKAVLVLSDWAGRITLDPEEIDAERGVVVEEWRLSQGAGLRLFDKQLPVLFQGALYPERRPIGTQESILGSPPEAIERFYQDWYRPDLMAVVAVGDFDPDRIEELIHEHLGSLVNPETPKPRRVEEIPEHAETLLSIDTDAELTSTRVTVIFKHPLGTQGTVGSYRQSLAERLHTSMFNSRTAELSQKDDPPFVVAGAGLGPLGRTGFIYNLDAMAKEGEVDRALETLLVEAERIDRYGFTESELERAKVNMMRGYEQMYQERDKAPSRAFASEYVRNFLEGESIPGIEAEVAMARRFLAEITLEEINALGSEWITEDNRVIFVSGPEKEGVELPTESDLLAVFDAASQKEIEPWVDQTLEKPLLAETPTPGEVVATETWERLGVTQWTLSNGVTVVLKPTDFQNDQILMAASSPGGDSLVPLEHLTSARFATAILGQSGLGEFPAIELGKALAGKVAGAAPYIGELEEGLEGQASPQDLETMLQLTYLHFTAPRLEDEAARNFVQRMGAVVQNRLQRPETEFVDEFQRRVSKDHPRRQPLSAETLEEIDPQAALRIYRERFADASDFTFFFVGNFDLASIEPMITTYIGGLPTVDREEDWVDPEVERPEGVVRFEVRRGIEPKALVRLLFHGDAEYTRDDSFLLNALSRILEIRFTEILREDLGLTYGVNVGGSISWRPDESYTFSASFGCNPDEVETITDALFAAVETMAKDGIDPLLVEKVTANLVRDREVQLEDNGFWLGILQAYWARGEDPNQILDYDDLVALVTPENAQKTLRRFLDKDQYILGVLRPETESATDAAEADAAGR